MAEIIFFPKNSLTGQYPSIHRTYFSEVFDATSYSEMECSLRLFGGQSTSAWVSGFIQTTFDPGFDDDVWTDLTTLFVNGTILHSTATVSGMYQFVRAKALVGAPQFVTFYCKGAPRSV